MGQEGAYGEVGGEGGVELRAGHVVRERCTDVAHPHEEGAETLLDLILEHSLRVKSLALVFCRSQNGLYRQLSKKR